VRASSFRVDLSAWGRVLAVALALTLTTAALAGCGSEDEPKADPSPTSKPSVPPGLDTTPPSKPQAAETKESAVEYGRYFAMLVQHAVRIRNVRPLMAEARDQAKCTSCRGVSEYIEKELRDDKVWAIEPDLRLGRFTARRTADGFKVLGKFDYPPGKFVTINGKKKDVASGGPYVFVADIVWDPDAARWQVLDYTFDDAPKR
jgi:hypothetical protein